MNFVMEHLLPYHDAFRAMISLYDEQLVAKIDRSRHQYDADVSWCRTALYNLMCFPTQRWRASALLAVKLAQNHSSNAAQAAAWLKEFLSELQVVSLAAIFTHEKSSKRKQQTFDAVLSNLQQVTTHSVLYMQAL